MMPFLLPLLLAVAPLNGERIYCDSTPVTVVDSVLTLPIGQTGIKSVRAEARVSLRNVAERPGLSVGMWSMYFTAPDDTLNISIRHGNSDFGDILDRRFTLLEISRNGSAIFSGKVDGFASSPGAFNTLTAELDTDGRLSVCGGGRSSGGVLVDVMLDNPMIPDGTAVSVSGGEGTVSVFCCEVSRSPRSVMATGWNMESLVEYFRTSSDPAEGFWTYLDRENDPEYARLGGRYVLATVGDGSGGYDIIYVDGAQTYAERWEPMMLKGRLIPTIFSSHYDLCWIDSSFEQINEDVHAEVTGGAILSLSFPMLKTVIRFSKKPLR